MSDALGVIYQSNLTPDDLGFENIQISYGNHRPRDSQKKGKSGSILKKTNKSRKKNSVKIDSKKTSFKRKNSLQKKIQSAFEQKAKDDKKKQKSKSNLKKFLN